MTGADEIPPRVVCPMPFDISEFLAPVSLHELIERYWTREPVYITGNANRISKIFSKARFTAAIERAHEGRNTEHFAVCRFAQDFDGAWTCSEGIEPTDIEQIVKIGQTVCVRGIAAGDDELAAFGASFARALGLVGSVNFNAYYSGNGSGADMHFDRSITCAIQIEGRKCWRFGFGPVLPWPPGNGRMQADGTPIYAVPWFGGRGWDKLNAGNIEIREVVLEVGDVLILPAGTWHEAKAIGGSLALNMAFTPLPFDAVMKHSMNECFDGMASWRGGLPASVSGPTSSSAEVSQYISARLAEMREVLDNGSLRAAIEKIYFEFTQ